MLNDLQGLRSPPQLEDVRQASTFARSLNYGHLALEELSEKRSNTGTLCRELLCIALACQWLGVTGQEGRSRWAKVQSFIHTFGRSAGDLSQTLRKERKTLKEALIETFGEEGLSTIGPSSPHTGHSRQTSRLASGNLHRRTGGLHIRFPGHYPTSPMIELDPATPSPEDPIFAETSFMQGHYLATEVEETAKTDFAPREALTALEREARASLMASYDARSKALSTAAAKLYVQRSQLDAYYREAAAGRAAMREDYMRAVIDNNESMREDVDVFLARWNDSRVALRQLLSEQERRKPKPVQVLPPFDRGALYASTSSLQTPELVGEGPSSVHLGKRDSTSSTLSTNSGTDAEHLATPATSPRTGFDVGPGRTGKIAHNDITQLLLEQTNPCHLPPAGLEEQLFEAFSGSDDAGIRPPRGLASREERIALAKQRRQRESTQAAAVPTSQMELVSELKDVMAVLR